MIIDFASPYINGKLNLKGPGDGRVEISICLNIIISVVENSLPCEQGFVNNKIMRGN